MARKEMKDLDHYHATIHHNDREDIGEERKEKEENHPEVGQIKEVWGKDNAITIAQDKINHIKDKQTKGKCIGHFGKKLHKNMMKDYHIIHIIKMKNKNKKKIRKRINNGLLRG